MNVFENGALFTPVVSAVFCVFPLSGFNLHAASILQSIAVNRLQCALLSVPASLYLTGCGSLVGFEPRPGVGPCRCVLLWFGANCT